MGKDKRYSTIKLLITHKHIQDFRAIFEHIPKSIVYADLGMNYSRFTKLLQNPALFSLQELITLASFFDVDPKTLIDLAFEQHLSDKKNKKRR
jgi:hypothetical protein